MNVTRRATVPDADAASLSVAALAEAGPIIARDPAMLAVVRRIEQVAVSAVPVLIAGESGTGKALVAAHLHRCSDRHSGRFVVVDCATLTQARLDLEFCGLERNAVGTADDATAAWASGRTLVLNEIGEMDPRIQAEIVRVLRQQEAERRTGGASAHSGVRILATTNGGIQEDVRAGRFRADLFFRLNVIEIKLPALRDRPADIPVLADHFARKLAGKGGIAALGITDAAMDVLLRHTWPGNVRELENVIHRAVLTETGPSISPAALAIDAIEPPPGGKCWAPQAVSTSDRTIEAVEKDMILDRLRQCKGNRAHTATTLGISIRTLRNKLNDYERNGTRIPKPVVITAV